MAKYLLTLFIFISIISQSQKLPKIGLVLSGGGAKGSAHVGTIRFLESKGIKPDFITGTSVGAMIGSLYAMGYTVDELEEIIKTTDWDYLVNDIIKRENLLIGQGNKNKNSLITLPLEGFKPSLSSGLYTGQNVLTFLEVLERKYNRKINFDSLPIPFRCVATNIVTGEEKDFNSGYLPKCVRASMSIPSVLEPVEIDDKLYVDGGIVNNFPTDVVKKMGADIIIGVDVGSSLYKKEEINSIMNILDQTSSLYNAKITAENKKLCDIYIRPNISGVSALDFSDTEIMIQRGYEAAQSKESQIDSVFRKYNLKPIIDTVKFIKNNIITIDSIEISTDITSKKQKREAENLILGKLDMETPMTLTDKELISRINRLFGSKFFQNISISFTPKDTSYILHLSAEQKQNDEFFFGARYDNTFGINLAVGANFRNKLIYGSLLEMKLIAGQSPQVKFRYTTDRGKSLGFGTSLEFNNFIVNAYTDGATSFTYNYNRLLWDIFIHTYLRNHNRILIGTEASVIGLSPTLEIKDIVNMKRRNLSIYLAYIADTWDDGYFPTRGNKTKFRGDLIIQEGGGILGVGWVRNNTIIPISKKFIFKVDAFLGLGSSGVDTTIYGYYIGGMAKNRIQWYNSFPGLHFLEQGNSNALILSVGPRWQMAKNSFLTYKFAAAILEDKPVNLLLGGSKIYSGMSITYSFRSMFGPMEASINVSMNNTYGSMFFNLGFWL